MLLCVNTVNRQMPDNRVATFQLRLHQLWIKKVRRPEEALQNRALVITIRRAHNTP